MRQKGREVAYRRASGGGCLLSERNSLHIGFLYSTRLTNLLHRMGIAVNDFSRIGVGSKDCLFSKCKH